MRAAAYMPPRPAPELTQARAVLVAIVHRLRADELELEKAARSLDKRGRATVAEAVETIRGARAQLFGEVRDAKA